MIAVDLRTADGGGGPALLLALLRMLADPGVPVAAPGAVLGGAPAPRVEFLAGRPRARGWKHLLGVRAHQSGGVSFRGALPGAGAPLLDALRVLDPRGVEPPLPAVYARDAEAAAYAAMVRGNLTAELHPHLPPVGPYRPHGPAAGRALLNPGALGALRMLGAIWDPEAPLLYAGAPTRARALELTLPGAEGPPRFVVETRCATEAQAAHLAALCARYRVPPPRREGPALYEGGTLAALRILCEETGYALSWRPEGAPPAEEALQ